MLGSSYLLWIYFLAVINCLSLIMLNYSKRNIDLCIQQFRTIRFFALRVECPEIYITNYTIRRTQIRLRRAEIRWLWTVLCGCSFVIEIMKKDTGHYDTAGHIFKSGRIVNVRGGIKMFKKMIAFVLAVVMSASCISTSAATLRGADINGDGKINITDLTRLAAFVKGKRSLSASAQKKADLNGDGKVNITDVTLMAAYIKGGKSAGQKTNKELADELAVLVNKERRSRGLKAYVYSSELSSAAAKRAQEISKSYGHYRPDGRECFTVLAEYGISVTSAGENIAYGYDTAQSACDAFMNSAPHRSSILDANKTYMGMGAYRASDGTIYWAQLFASGSGMSGKQV